MRTTAAVLVALALLTGSAAASSTGSDAPSSNPIAVPQQAPTATAEITDQVSTVDPSGTTPAGTTSSGSGPRYEYRTTVLQGPCPVTPLDATPQLVSYERRLLPNGAWEPYGGGCTGQEPAAAEPVLDLGSILTTAVTVRASVPATPPDLAVQPSTGALVNQPAIFSVADPGPPASASAVNPLSGRTVTVSLAPPTYRWTFGDGAGTGPTTSRGRAYSAGATVPQEGGGAPWITHTYRAPGTRTVTVTATYPASYTFTGNTQGPLGLDSLVVSDSVVLQVRAARSELVRD